MKVVRCTWPKGDLDMISYHDHEWGVPVHDDRVLFEFLILEGAQAGLTWQTILKRREGYRKAFKHFDPVKISKYTASDSTRLLSDPGIIRNRLKIKGTIENAKKFIEIQKSFGSFNAYLWQFTGGKPIIHRFTSSTEIPMTTKESDALSKDLKQRGFAFVGSTICYAFMQAIGMVNDHLISCFRYKEILSGK